MIDWPEEWDAEEGWLTLGQDTLTNGQRSTGALHASLVRHHGQKLKDRVEAMGGPSGHLFGRTLENLAQRIREFYRQHGRRPTARGWPNEYAWLKTNHHLSLAEFCDQQGIALPETLSEIQEAARQEYMRAGRWPVDSDSSVWRRRNYLLNKAGTSLAQVRRDLGYPGRDSCGTRTIDQADQAIKSYWKEHKKRPSSKASQEFRNWDAWLWRQGSSVRARCDAMGLPVSTASSFIRKHLEKAPAEIVRLAKKRGVTFSPNLIYAVRNRPG